VLGGGGGADKEKVSAHVSWLFETVITDKGFGEDRTKNAKGKQQTTNVQEW